MQRAPGCLEPVHLFAPVIHKMMPSRAGRAGTILASAPVSCPRTQSRMVPPLLKLLKKAEQPRVSRFLRPPFCDPGVPCGTVLFDRIHSQLPQKRGKITYNTFFNSLLMGPFMISRSFIPDRTAGPPGDRTRRAVCPRRDRPGKRPQKSGPEAWNRSR